jgi:type II secretory ATPase GspE/PulE/Tfp pilus assembly ATPase PilB-like protein
VPCEFCKDLRFKGRTAVYEFFVIDDEAREQIAAGAAGKQLQAVFRKQRGKFLQEEALTMVERGDTSVQEVLRVMKGGDTPAAPQEPAAA